MDWLSINKVMDVAEIINSKKDEILKNWLRKLKKEIPEVKKYKKSAIENDVPELLNALVIALREGSEKPLIPLGEAHGEQRINFDSYSLIHIIREYRILKEIILAEVDSVGQMDLSDRDRISFGIDQAIEQGGERYFQLEKQRLITAQLEAEENIEKLKNDDRVRDIFISSVSHDLNNPITAIKIMIQLLEDKSDIKDQEKLLNIIKISAQKAEKLINDLLDVNRMQSGAGFSLQKKECDLLMGLKNTINRCDLQYEGHITLNSPHETLVIKADCDALVRATDNLMIMQ